ncbi:MAG: Mrp/NBP35 family ATP-binding protein [Candidatus Binatia bacterium]
MAALTPDGVRLALKGVLFPGFRRDIVALGMVTDVRVEGGIVHVSVRSGTDKPEVHEQLVRSIQAVLARDAGAADVRVHLVGAAEGRGRDPFAERAGIPDVRHVIAVASTKGGVGKSTVAANLAVALAEATGSAGLLDADVYGPSVPIMFATGSDRPRITPDKRIHPIERCGVKLVSMGFFLDERSPVIWRGPIVMGIVRQFLRDVQWGPLEFLVVDLPPGTGDAVLTLVQQVPITGGVVVTTPQDVALLDVGRGIAMFAQVQVPILGVVENMSGYVCPECGTRDPVFGEGGARGLAERFGVPLLGQIPLVPAVRTAGDRGRPIVAAEPGHPVAHAFRELARRVVAEADRVALEPISGTVR